MKSIVFVLLFMIVFNGFSQENKWVSYCFENKNSSNVEYSQCLEQGVKKANLIFEMKYKTIFNLVNEKLKSTEPSSELTDILKIYLIQLPILYDSMKKYSKAITEIESASNVGGSGYIAFKYQKLLIEIDSNIKKLEKIENELLTFN